MTYAVLERQGSRGEGGGGGGGGQSFSVRVIKQKLWVDGVTYELKVRGRGGGGGGGGFLSVLLQAVRERGEGKWADGRFAIPHMLHCAGLLRPA